MWYIVTQIWIWLLIAFALGCVVGWRSTRPESRS